MTKYYPIPLNRSSSFFSLLLCSLLFFSLWCPASPGEENAKPKSRSFHFLRWPGVGSVIQETKAINGSQNSLLTAWNEGRLLSYTGQTLELVSEKSDSLEKFLRWVRYSQPECIEGDKDFILEEINSQDPLYAPILQEIEQKSENKETIHGEIVFLDKNDLWHGKLGVVHPKYSVGGKFQINYWKEQSEKEPDIVSLYSPQETLRHLFIGDIHAAAIPEGAVEIFLKAHNREDLSEHLIRIRMPQTAPLPTIFLRKDLFSEPLARTLIAETWLRNGFPEWMIPVPIKFLSNQ